ncbi:MAG: hypothetical protein JWR52_644 [Marmoricola sp.]|nr:hypothetical protein [Marmoricola sp.]
MRRFFLTLVIVLSAVLAVPQLASAHVERPSYWPDPAPDCSVSPCAGGAIPHARSLASALNASAIGTTRVVCHADSMVRLRRSIAAARAHGYYIRPTDHRSLSARGAARLLRINRALFRMCSYHQIQRAVTASHNNDRVVVMPGLYTEPHSRAQPTFDARCAQYRVHSDSGDPGALSHEYQLKCPNDANLISIEGRGLGNGVKADPDPALVDRHGIPNQGRCIRCNFQLEGSGVSADDVIVEAGNAKKGDGGPSAAGHKKDVGIFVDRADGFVLRNLTVRHAREHDIYILETDGYLFDRFKTFYAGSYGVLTFVEDHGLVENCEAAGNGDSGIYPGAGAPTLVDRDVAFYPMARFSQEFRDCDVHHNTGGFSGTDSHGTLIDHNNFYNNALGFTTDVFTAAGHPGFPQQGNVIRDNNFYSNNFNPFNAGSDVQPFIGAPVGTGLWLAGGNDNVVEGNHFWNNWRRGMMLFAVPDATVCGPVLGTTTTPIPGCSITGISTSYRNRIHGNTMGLTPGGTVRPNGTDFFWDSFPTNTGNCWWNNKAAPGKQITSSPGLLPSCSNGTMPSTSIGLGDVGNEAELVACLAGYQLSGYPAGNSTVCTWTNTPARPGSAARQTASSRAGVSSAQLQSFAELCSGGPMTRTCAPFVGALASVVYVANAIRPLMPTTQAALAATDTKPLSMYTCSWWRQASSAQKAGLLQRVRTWTGGPVSGNNTTLVGYGNVLRASNAATLFDDRCSTSYAGAFALYKIYGAASAFAAAH